MGNTKINPLPNILEDIKKDIASEGSTKLDAHINIIQANESFDAKNLYEGEKNWHAFKDIVVVSIDLEKSTDLAFRIKDKENLAKVYNTAMGMVTKIFAKFGATYVDIQGDGGFALFWDSKRYSRAITAAIVVQTYNVTLIRLLREKFAGVETRGFKVGIASGEVLAKKVGLTNRKLGIASSDSGWKEPIWSGNPVNFAVKACQSTEPQRLVVTASVWEKIKANQWLTHSCHCSVKPSFLWEAFEIPKVPGLEKNGYRLKEDTGFWCEKCGNEFVNKILKEDSLKRKDVEANWQ